MNNVATNASSAASASSSSDSSSVSSADTQAIQDQVAKIFPELVAVLKELVAIPSVSAAAFDQTHVETSATVVADLFRAVGFNDVQILRAPKPVKSNSVVEMPQGGGLETTSDSTTLPVETANTAQQNLGAPAVVARRPAAPGQPTLMLYAHHDVQPPGQGWDTEPFVATQKGDRLYGRGAGDDKAGIIVHLGALKALTALNALPNIGITLFIEGEEEIGSPSFANFLAEYKHLLHADVIVVADSGNWAIGTPALTTSLRGLVDGVVEVQVLDHAVHSGMFGGPVLDANVILARLISTLHDAQGNVAVNGLTEAPAPTIDYTEADLRKDSSLLDSVQLAGTGSITSRLWTKPAISVLGIDAVPVAEAANVIAPSARAKISMRIPVGQDPAAASKALGDHLVRNAPFGAQVSWHPHEAGNPFQAPDDSPAMQTARTAFRAAWYTEPVDMGMGGSIPFIAELKKVYPNAEILLTGVEDPDSRAHGANESVHLGELQKAIVAEAVLLRTL